MADDQIPGEETAVFLALMERAQGNIALTIFAFVMLGTSIALVLHGALVDDDSLHHWKAALAFGLPALALMAPWLFLLARDGLKLWRRGR